MSSSAILDGKNAVVTGGSSGIGFAIARGLIEAGAKVMITGRNKESLDKAVVELGENSFGFAMDVSKEADVEALMKAAQTQIGPIEILVNNAGISPWFTRSEKVELSEWQTIIDVNLTGVFLCTRIFGRKMLEGGKGSIINITSVGARAGLSRQLAYCAAKAGVEGMTRSLTKDWASQGVRVNNVAPGYVRTKMTAGFVDNDALRADLLQATPMDRLGEGAEIASAVVYLASDAASYVCGTTIAVDGGWVAT
ncbi:MAG: 3-oxoacyl-ACP reductase FabG [Rhodobacteraceae bacterium]|nr:3-oxoacyl-ACP reductase FabG [Paracoccaceae bacterium]